MMKNMIMLLCGAILLAGCAEPITIQVNNDSDSDDPAVMVKDGEDHEGDHHDDGDHHDGDCHDGHHCSHHCSPCCDCGYVIVEDYYYVDPWYYDGYVYYDDVYVDAYYYDDGYYY
jgi:hypothetical protein